MSDVKGRLKEILNTTLGGSHTKQKSYDLGSGNRNIYSPSRDSKTMDLSIDNFKKNKSSRGESFHTSSIFNKSPQYTPISTQSSINGSSNTSKSKLFNFGNNSKISNLDLIIPSSNTPLYFSKYSAAKIKKDINEIHKTISIGTERNQGFRNRPALNLNRKDLEFNSREFFATSPTVTNRNLLTTSNTIKKYGANQRKFSSARNSGNLLSGSNMNAISLSNKSEFDSFAKELLPNSNKFSVFEKFNSSSRRKKSSLF